MDLLKMCSMYSLLKMWIFHYRVTYCWFARMYFHLFSSLITLHQQQFTSSCRQRWSQECRLDASQRLHAKHGEEGLKTYIEQVHQPRGKHVLTTNSKHVEQFHSNQRNNFGNTSIFWVLRLEVLVAMPSPCSSSMVRRVPPWLSRILHHLPLITLVN